MFIDWLKSLRGSNRHSRRQIGGHLSSPVVLEPRTLMSAVPVGNEVRVNSYTTGNQTSADVASDASGNYVVTWQSDGQDGSGNGIYAQRYNALGAPLGSEFKVNSYTNDHQTNPSIAMEANGDFVIVWEDQVSLPLDAPQFLISAQRFSADGTPLGSQFYISQLAPQPFAQDSQFRPSVAMDSDGDFVVTWFEVDGEGVGEFGIDHEYSVKARRFNFDGVAVGNSFLLDGGISHSYTGSVAPAVAMAPAGSFIIAWESPNNLQQSIVAQRFDAAGVSLASEIQVSVPGSSVDHTPDLAIAPNGEFVVAWDSYNSVDNSQEVFARRFLADGTPIAAGFRVNSFTTSNQSAPVIALDQTGNFTIAWNSQDQDGSNYGIYRRSFDFNGLAVDSDTRVNTYIQDGQFYPALAMDPEGDFIIAWQSLGQDLNISGIYAQSFSNVNDPPHANPDTVSTPQGVSRIIDVLANDTDVDTLHANLYVVPGTLGYKDIDGNLSPGVTKLGGTVTLRPDGRVNYVPPPNVSGQDEFSYGLSDGSIRLAPVGSEFLVKSSGGMLSTSVNGIQVAADGDGDYVVTWLSYEGGAKVLAQRYNSSGQKVGPEIQPTFGVQNAAPVVAMNAAGNFVIVGSAFNSGFGGWVVAAQRYAADGTPLGAPSQVSTVQSYNVASLSVSMNNDGDYAIAWETPLADADIYARTYDSTGTPLTSEFLVHQASTLSQRIPGVALADDGSFVVVWQERRDPANISDSEIKAQRFNSAGVKVGSEFFVNSILEGRQDWPAIAMSANSGEFIVTWTSRGSNFASRYDVFAQRYHADGTLNGPEFVVTPNVADDQLFSRVSMAEDGSFVVIWEHGTPNSPLKVDVFLRSFDPSGNPLNPELRVNTTTLETQYWGDVALSDNGKIVVVWHSDPEDDDIYDLYAQQFNLQKDTYSTNVTVNVIPPNTAPTLNNAGSPTLNSILQNVADSDNPGTLVADIIAGMGPAGGITDPDFDPLGIAINGISNTYGSWEFTVNNGTNWTPIAVTGNTNALLLAADANTRVRFLPNPNFIGSSLFAFVAWDRTTGANGGTANVAARGGTTPYSLAYEYASINVVNVAPVLDPAGSPTLDTIVSNLYNANNPGTLVADIIARMAPSGGITDANPGALQGIAINGLLNTNKGSWQFTTNGGTSWISIGTTGNSDARLLAADANTRIRFVPIAGFAGTASFAFVAWDRTSGFNGGITSVGTRGGSTPYSLAYDYASISVVNAAPVLNDAGNPLFDGLLPDTPAASNPGTLVSALIARMYPAGGITDANPGALRGIAIIGKTATATGTWEYSTNNGTTWLAINATGGANALLLASDANTRVRYRPNPGYRGEAKIAFAAWDQTTGTNGATVNASTRGGTTAYSTAYEYASLFVNTAPTLNNAGTPTLDSISNTLPVGSNTGILVSTLLSRMAPAGGITDPDPAALKGLAIIGQNGTATGSWQYSTNGGTSWTNVTTTGSANALLLASDGNTRIRYVPNAGFTGTVVIAFTAWDRSQWLNGSTINAGARGGATPFSTDYDYATITIT